MNFVRLNYIQPIIFVKGKVLQNTKPTQNHIPNPIGKSAVLENETLSGFFPSTSIT